jgi:hypothetical protein
LSCEGCCCTVEFLGEKDVANVDPDIGDQLYLIPPLPLSLPFTLTVRVGHVVVVVVVVELPVDVQQVVEGR